MRDSGSPAWATGDAINKKMNMDRGQQAFREMEGCIKREKITLHLGHIDSDVGT